MIFTKNRIQDNIIVLYIFFFHISIYQHVVLQFYKIFFKCVFHKKYQSAWVAIINYHRPGGLNKRHLFFHSSGGFKFMIKVLANLVSDDSSLPAFVPKVTEAQLIFFNLFVSICSLKLISLNNLSSNLLFFPLISVLLTSP